MTTPKPMRAWQYTSTKGGLVKNLFLNPNTPIPIPSSTQHLIKIKAVALNPVDYKPAEVRLLHLFALPKPATPGVDFVGEVVKPASQSALKAGQIVFGVGKNPFAGGMLAEYAVAEVDGCVELPERGMEAVDGASVGVAALTAYQSIKPKVKAGDRVFINGGSGGTGIFGIQIAKALGLDVTVTCSSKNVKLCESLGAEVIDYSTMNVLDALKAGAEKMKYDLVIDNVFNDPNLYWKAHEYTSSAASYVVIAGTPSLAFVSTTMKMRCMPAFLGGGKRKSEGFFAQPNAKDLTQIRTWFVEGKLRSVIDQRFPFEQAPQAFEKLKTGRAVGKIIVDVESS